MTRKNFLFGASAILTLPGFHLLADVPPRMSGADTPFGAGARVPSGRIRRLLERALAADVRPAPVPVVYDAADLSLPEPIRIGKRLKEFMSAQPVTLRADEELVGWLSFDESVENDLFPRRGHKAFC